MTIVHTRHKLRNHFDDWRQKNLRLAAVAVRTCRVCGCTDADCRQCIAKTGHPCSWVETNLCSACVAPKEAA